MGNTIKSLKRAQEEEDERTKETLTHLSNFMIQKCASSSAQLKELARNDQDLPIVAIVDKTEKYTLGIKETPNEEITDGIKDMFSGNFFSGLGKLICGTIQVFLGDRSAGQSETKAFHVLYANNSLLRIDYMVYKYTFSSQGVLSKYENAVCFLFQVGVLDLQKVNPQVLLFELTKTIGGDPQKIKDAAEELKSVAIFAKTLYSTIQDLNEAAKQYEKNKPKQLQEVDQDNQQDGTEQDLGKAFESSLKVEWKFLSNVLSLLTW